MLLLTSLTSSKQGEACQNTAGSSLCLGSTCGVEPYILRCVLVHSVLRKHLWCGALHAQRMCFESCCVLVRLASTGRKCFESCCVLVHSCGVCPTSGVTTYSKEVWLTPQALAKCKPAPQIVRHTTTSAC